MAISTTMSGKAIDDSLRAINEAENSINNGLIIYIRDGKLSFDTYENLFDIAEWEDE